MAPGANPNRLSDGGPMIIGFTGSQTGMTLMQRATLDELLLRFNTLEQPNQFHYGECIGADEEAANDADVLGYKVYAHPCTLTDKRIPEKRRPLTEHTYPVAEPLDRNHHIISVSRVMIATPNTDTEKLRSGTWATIRYTGYRQYRRELHLIRPDGTVKVYPHGYDRMV
jgi:hypothetical protein